MKTSELAQAVGVTPETVRFYTRKGLLIATRQPENGYKIYDTAALERLKFISHAKAIGFSLKEIEHIIQLSQQGSSPCPTVRQMLESKITEAKRKIEELNRHLGIMENTFSDWSKEPDTLPDNKAICCLIDDWSETQSTN
jgi:DNA-binding transcriptional MerR regulator